MNLRFGKKLTAWLVAATFFANGFGTPPVFAGGTNYTSVKSGNWSDPTVWTPAGVPSVGDKAVVNHDVTVNTDAAIGDGTSSTVLDVTNGTLTVVGAKLTLRGNATFGKYNTGTVVFRLVVKNSGSAAGGIELDGNSGIAPTVSFSDDTAMQVTGVSTARCFLRTKSGTLGNPGQFKTSGTLRSFYINVSYCDIARLGDASNPGISAPYLYGGSNPIFSFDHVAVDSCGITPSATIQDGSVNFSLTNSIWTNAVGANTLVVGAGAAVPITTGTRLVDHCLFHGIPAFPTPTGFTITNNYFDDSIGSVGEYALWKTFDGNFVKNDDGGGERQFAGDISNSYFFLNPAVETAGTANILTAQVANSQISNNVFQYTGTRGDVNAIVFTEAGPNSRTITIKNNIVLPTGSSGSMTLGSLTSNSSVAWTDYGILEHNTALIGNVSAIYDGATVGTKSGTIPSLKSNIFYRTGGAPSNQFAFANVESSPHLDVVTAANADYNAWYNLALVPNGTWQDIADGTVYSTPMSGTTKPGIHDVANVNPQFVDATRNFQSWDASLGGPGTVAGALARIQADPTLTKSSLLPYVRAGFAPTNLALKGAAHDGGDIGAVPVVSLKAPTAYTSVKSGNWSDASVWTPTGVPGAGDTAVVNHDVTVIANATIGDGSNSTALDVTNGTLTVNGAVLTIRGNSKFGKYNNGNGVIRLAVQSSGSIPGGIELDGNAGVSPILNLDSDTIATITGTSSARCFVRTKAATVGNAGRITSSTIRSGYINASTCDFARLGDASHDGITAFDISALATGQSILAFDHCTFDFCASSPKVVIRDGAASFSLTNSIWTNPVGTSGSVNLSAYSAPLTTGVRLVDHCRFFGTNAPVWSGALDFTVTNCYFDDTLTGDKNQKWKLFDGNLVRSQVIHENIIAGDVTNSYFFADPANEVSSSNLFHILTGFAYDSTIQGNIFQYVGTRTNSTAIVVTEHGPVDHTITIKDNIVLPNGSGTSGPLAYTDSNTSDSISVYQIMEHNTVSVGDGRGVYSGLSVGQKAGTLLSLQSNVFWRSGAALPGTYAIRNEDPNPVEIVTAAHADYNGWYGLATVPAGTWNDIADGTVYSTPMSGTTKPGVHDVANTDPQFADSSRNLQTWDASVGGAGTIAGALARIQADPTLTKSSLLPYVRAGFAPTNAALKGAAHDGTDIGAVPVLVQGPATAYTLTGPTTAAVGQPSNFQLSPNGKFSGTITPGEGGAGGTFTPASVTWSGTSETKTFTYTASSTGQKTISTTNNVSLPNPSAIVVTVSNSDTTPPTISNVASSNLSSSGATINWTTDENSDSQVEYGLTTTYGNSTTLNTSMVTSHTQTLNGLAPNTLYYFRVKSKDTSNNIATSADFTFTTLPASSSGAPAAPTGLTAVSGDQMVTLKWNANTEADLAGYLVYWSLDANGPYYALNTTVTPQTTIIKTGLYDGTPYYYRVTAVNQAGDVSTVSETVESTPQPSGTGGGNIPVSVNPNVNFSITPNPCVISKHCEAMTFSSAKEATVTLYTRDGREIAAYETPAKVSIHSLPSGTNLAVFRGRGSEDGTYSSGGSGTSKGIFVVVK